MGLAAKEIGTVINGGHQYPVLGRDRQLEVGDIAPNFKLKYVSPRTQKVSQVNLGDFDGSVLVLHLAGGYSLTEKARVINRLDGDRRGLDVPPGKVNTVSVSLDSPTTLANLRRRHGIRHLLASAEGAPVKFGLEYGALIKERDRRFLREAVFVIYQRIIRHADYFEDMSKRIDFMKALEAAKHWTDDILMDDSMANLFAQLYHPERL